MSPRAQLAHLDCFSGASGDMLLGALLDAGLPIGALKRDLARLRLPPFGLTAKTVRRGSVSARLATVAIRRPFPRQPTFAGIASLVRRSRLPSSVIERALACLRALHETEVELHGRGELPDAFRGVALLDTLVDVVGVVAGFERLGITSVTVSPINLGRGMIGHASAPSSAHHGPLPVPAPATARLLRGFSIFSDGPAAELTTPTAAALIRTLARPSPTVPLMRLTAVGHGAGHYRLDPWPNLVRLLVGHAPSIPATTAPPHSVMTEESLVEIETTVDDCIPQLFDHLRDRLFARGALDVYLTPVIMKQGRPATHISVLADPARAADLIPLLYEETPTLGVRLHEIRRWILPRRQVRLRTQDGTVRVKLVRTPRGWEARPEYRDGRAIAERTGEPLRAVLKRLEWLAERRFALRRGGLSSTRRRR
ncbi:MAG TPA: LarC family nickel insertion protein [Nitrospiria bacterium]|nr:LarC family nickel insertion protein [Nitrospiria bacterium]